MRITLSTDEAISIKVKLELMLMDVSPDEDNEVLKALIEKIDKELKKPTPINGCQSIFSFFRQPPLKLA